jgi:hypothetical protein
LYIHTTFFFYPFISCCSARLSPALSYCE